MDGPYARLRRFEPLHEAATIDDDKPRATRREMSRFVALGAVLVVAGCESVLGADFDRPAAQGTADGGAPGPEGSAREDCASSIETPTPTDGAGTVDAACAFADCRIPRPSNRATFGALPIGGATLTVGEEASFNTDDACAGGSILGECAAVLQTQGPAACVCTSGSLTVRDLKVTGSRALVLLVQGVVTITGTIDVAATGDKGGPGSEPAPEAPADSGLFVHGTPELVPLRGGAAAINGSSGGGALQISAGGSIVVEPVSYTHLTLPTKA